MHGRGMQRWWAAREPIVGARLFGRVGEIGGVVSHTQLGKTIAYHYRDTSPCPILNCLDPVGQIRIPL